MRKNATVSSSHQKYQGHVPSKRNRRLESTSRSEMVLEWYLGSEQSSSTVVNVQGPSVDFLRQQGVWKSGFAFWDLVSHFGLYLCRFIFNICLNLSAALFSTSKQNKKEKNAFKRKQNLCLVVSQVNWSQFFGTTQNLQTPK